LQSALGADGASRYEAGLSYRSILLLLACALLPPFACGPDAEPPPPCENEDFNVLIRAASGDLPADTVVTMIYGSGREEYRVGEEDSPLSLFCEPATRDGEALDPGDGSAGAGGSPAGGASGAGGASASAGAGGATGATNSQGVPALRCSLWTDGPATLEITAEGYPKHTVELELRRGTCTVDELIELMQGDAGA